MTNMAKKMIVTPSICHQNSDNSHTSRKDRRAQKRNQSDEINSRIHQAKLANNPSVLKTLRHYSNKQKIPYPCLCIKDT